MFGSESTAGGVGVGGCPPPAFKDPASELNETIYLCNFRVSVDGEWLCLKELEDFGTVVQAKGKNFPSTPEFEQIVRYPDYPLGKKGLG